MAYEDITVLLGGWPGFAIATVTREPRGTRSGAPQITIELMPLPGRRRYCELAGTGLSSVSMAWLPAEGAGMLVVGGGGSDSEGVAMARAIAESLTRLPARAGRLPQGSSAAKLPESRR